MTRHALEVSPHAVARYRERIDPAATDVEAEAALVDAARGARRLFRQGSDRAVYRVGGATPYRLVIRECRGRPPAVLTVLFEVGGDGEVDPDGG